MQTLRHSPANRSKVVRVESTLESLLAEVLTHGFFGTAKLELLIAEGTIHRITRTVERVDKVMKTD